MKFPPDPPFIWPESRIIEGMFSYKEQPPFDSLAVSSASIFGIVSELTAQGVNVLESWLARNEDLRIRLIVTVYPTCATKENDLLCILDLVNRCDERLIVHIKPLDHVTDRTSTILCFINHNTDTFYLATGPSEDLGLKPWIDGMVNLVFKADLVQVDAFKCYFDWLWAHSADITWKSVAHIPDLVLPEGTEEAFRMWQKYRQECSFIEMQHLFAKVDPETGEVTIMDGEVTIPPPTTELGLAKLDRLAELVSRIYERGTLVSIDKLSRIPPLDAPLDPSAFGDSTELQKGNITRKVSMRVSIIDEKALKEIEKRRQGLRTLLTKFTFSLADNMRWMPFSARELFESELKRLNEEGQKLISDLLKGDVDAFIKSKQSSLIDNINSMYTTLGRQGKVTEDVILKVTESLKERLTKACSANFMPKLSYSLIQFVLTENILASPWGQAYSLLKDIATYPRKALTDGFFFRGLKVSEEDLIESMNVAEDVLCSDLSSRGIKKRCKDELDLLTRIEASLLDSRDKCGLVHKIITGSPIDAVNDELKEKEKSQNQ